MNYLILIPIFFAYLFITVVFYNVQLNNLAEESKYRYLTLSFKDKVALVLIALAAPFIGIFVWDVWRNFRPLDPPVMRKHQWEQYSSAVGTYFKKKGQDLIVWDSYNEEVSVDRFSNLIYEMVGPCSVERAVDHYGDLFAEIFVSYIILSPKMVMIGDTREEFKNAANGVTSSEWIDRHVYPPKQSLCKRFLENNFQQGYLVVPHAAMLNLFRQHVYAKYRS
jgi:hypothetical protein